VGENVGGIVSWDGGLVFEQVQTEMEAEGYEVQAFVLPACAVNAPHRRDRVWFVAHRSDDRQIISTQGRGNDQTPCFGVLDGITGQSNTRTTPNTSGPRRKERKHSGFGTDCPQDGAGLHDRPERFGSNGNARNANIRRRYKGTFGKVFGKEQGTIAPRSRKLDGWKRFPTQSPVCSRNDGFSAGLAGITVSRHRRESIKAYGNAIVPQVAVQIFKAIIEAERRMNP